MFDPQSAEELRDQLVGSRRQLVWAIWERGVTRGESRPDTDPDVALDLVSGPAGYRMIAGQAPLDDPATDAIVDVARRGLAR
jgi:hypothetical protein